MKKMYSHGLLLLFLIVSCGDLAAQKLFAVSVQSGEIHSLRLPQTLRVTHLGVTDQLQVTGVTADGITTSIGTIRLESIDNITAARYHAPGKKVLGILITSIGLLTTGLGIASIVDGFGSAGSALAIVGGIGVTAGGISLASGRKTYTPDKWQFRVLPADAGKVDVTSVR